MSDPLVSVIVPTFNRANFIGETLDSIIAQSYPNWECIVVDDGSEDDTQKVVNEYLKRDIRIQFYQRDRPPKNANTCRNIGIEKSAGKYLMFLDSDDMLMPHTLENRVSKIKNSDYAFTLNYSFMYNEGNLIERKVQPPTEETQIRMQFLAGVWPYNTPSLFIEKKTIKNIGGLDENLVRIQDPDLYLRLTDPSLGLTYTASRVCDIKVRIHAHSNRSKDNVMLTSLGFSYFLNKHLTQLSKNHAEFKIFCVTIYKYNVTILNRSSPADIMKNKDLRSAIIKVLNNKSLKITLRLELYLIYLSFILIPNRIGYWMATRMNHYFFG